MFPGQNPNFMQDYCIDACQRAILTLDALRERGNTALKRSTELAPHVLQFDFDVVRDGRTLEKPVNYVLIRIVPPAGMVIDPAKAPFIVFDPRAGHGPGIGGMKQESEIGVALAAGHPCYFVGFLPQPVPGQTIADVCRAQAQFVTDVAERHPEAEGKPVLISNCQAGWQIMMTAALRPDLMGPIVIVGSPLSYWAGVRGRSPMRYLGGILGGTWLTALAGDLGSGIFDGANLVANFESLNPANTYWEKGYNLYSKIDTEASRFLDYETWWGSPVLLNAGEMQWIADNLFVGNKLTAGEIHTPDGVRVDLRNIKSPIIVFCSWGDDITPPQQALGWITRPLRRRPRDRRQWPDHRLHAAPDDRSSRHLRFGQGGDQGACRVRLVHRNDRYDAPRPVRGRHQGGRAGDRAARPDTRKVSVYARGAYAGRHPRTRYQQ